MSFLGSASYPSVAHFPSVATHPSSPAFPVGWPLLLNVQKLSLPANTAVGIQIAVTDGFVVSGDPQGENGFYYESGEIVNGKPKCVHYPPSADQDIFWDTSGNNWINDLGVFSSSDVAHFWLATDSRTDHDGYTLAHPALQQLTAPATAQGGVFIPNGTWPGVYFIHGSENGKDRYELLGNGDTLLRWGDLATAGGSNLGNAWIVHDTAGDGAVYYSLSAVATPDLATNWKNASDDSPASITVATFTQGALNAGLKISSTLYVVNGSSNGRNKYSDVLGVATDVTWNGSAWIRGITEVATGNTAFPWDADWSLALIAVVRDDVASESNWEVA